MTRDQFTCEACDGHGRVRVGAWAPVCYACGGACVVDARQAAIIRWVLWRERQAAEHPAPSGDGGAA